MFLGCTIVMAALAASAAATTTLRARQQNNHAVETPYKCASLRRRAVVIDHDLLHSGRLVSSVDCQHASVPA